jgi:hypothetical protein
MVWLVLESVAMPVPGSGSDSSKESSCVLNGINLGVTDCNH